MYSTNFYPDGLTEPIIDALIEEAYASAESVLAEPTSTLLDPAAINRRNRRIERRTVNGTVRMLPVRRVTAAGPDGQEAA
jgi:hypothetical protein